MGKFLTSPDARDSMLDLLNGLITELIPKAMREPLDVKGLARFCSGAGADLQYRLTMRCSICRFPQAARL
jgi:hypothetical protein